MLHISCCTFALLPLCSKFGGQKAPGFARGPLFSTTGLCSQWLTIDYLGLGSRLKRYHLDEHFVLPEFNHTPPLIPLNVYLPSKSHDF